MKLQRYNNLIYAMEKRMISRMNAVVILFLLVSTVLRQPDVKVVAATMKHKDNLRQSQQWQKGLLRQEKRHRRLGKGGDDDDPPVKRKSNKDEYDDEKEEEDSSLDLLNNNEDVVPHTTAMTVGGLFVLKPLNENEQEEIHNDVSSSQQEDESSEDDNECDDEDEDKDEKEDEDENEDDTEQDENNDQDEEGEDSPLMIDALENPLDGELAVAAQQRVDESEQQDYIEVVDEGNIPVIVPMSLNSPSITDELDEDESDEDIVAADTRLYEVLSNNLDTVASLPGDNEDNNNDGHDENEDNNNVESDDEDEDLLLPEQIQVMGKEVIPMEGLAKTLVDGKIIILDSNEDDEAEQQEDVALHVVEELITPSAKTMEVDVDEEEDSSQDTDEEEEQDLQGDKSEEDLATSLTFSLEDEMTSLEETIDEIDPETEEEATSEQPPIVMVRSRSPPRPGDTDGTIGIDLTTETEAAEGEPPSTDEEQEASTSSSFVEESAASENDISLKLTYDKTKFQFLDPTQIKAGQTTCGFLNAPLGYVPGEEFETFIKVYFCMRFANMPESIPSKQPWLVVHCGGPGTLSDCAERMKGSYLSDKMLDMYHVVSFDQRGLGRSWPNFAHEECTFGIRQPTTANRNDILSLIRQGTSSPEKPQLEGIFIDSIDLFDSQQIDDYLDQSERRALKCWTCTTCEFHFESLKTGEKYHFLDYSGTQQVAQDLNYFRQIFSIDKLNLLGASYGTQIFMTYVSLYEDKVDKLVLDASMSPIVDWNHVATTFAQSLDSRLNYLNYSCRIKHFKFQMLKEHPTTSSQQLLDLEGTQFEQDCPIQNLAQCFQDVTQVLQSSLQQEQERSNLYGRYTDKALTHISIANHLMYMSSYDGGPTSESKQYLKQLCDSAALSVSAASNPNNDYDLDLGDPSSPIVESIPTILMKYIRSLNASSTSSKRSSSSFDKNCSSCPTRLSNVMDHSHYATIMGYNESYTTTSVAEALVLAQTLSGNVHNKEFIKRQISDIMTNYPGLGTHEPARRYLYLMALGYGWPESHPISPPSSIQQTGLITSQLYDPNTPYKWTQEVKLHSFPSMTLLTSQWMEHGFIQHDIADIHHQENDKEVTTNNIDHENSSSSNIQHDNDCFHHILQYFETGIIEVDDGTVCRTGYHNFFDSEMNDSDAIQLSPSTVGQPLTSTSVIDKDGFQVGQPQDEDDAELLMEILEEEVDVPNQPNGNRRRTLLRATKQF